jgi:hypothetical protein
MDLSTELPGGTEETLGKSIQKEFERYQERLNSVNPREINETIRDLDSRIKSYRAPEEPLDTPSDAADAARVTIRRALRDKLNVEIPESKPLNAQISPEMENRAFLRKKFKDVAFDPDAADAQYASELQKGKQQISNKAAQIEQDEKFKADTERIKAEHTGTQDAVKKNIDSLNEIAKENYEKEIARIKAEHGAKEDISKGKIKEQNDAALKKYNEEKARIERKRGIVHGAAAAAATGILGEALYKAGKSASEVLK